jgi:isocitrate dehydrogenase (NAD+)
MAHQVTLIPGDGIGPEVTSATLRVIAAANVSIDWVVAEAGADVVAKFGTALPPATVETVVRVGVALKGPTGTPVGGGHASANVALRKALNLYANLRPVRSQVGVKTRYEDVDLIVVRENTEDLYSGIEHVVVPGVVETIKIITEQASTRIAKFAFEHAEREKRKKVTAVHKANIMKLSDGLFLDCCRKVARAHPTITYDEAIVDACCMQLVKDPGRYDVLLLENLYGDIVSDLCAGLVGGLGVVPGANLGEHCAVFEAVHGTAPDIAGKGLANPTACLRSSTMMLRHLGEAEAAARTASTAEYTDALIAALG